MTKRPLPPSGSRSKSVMSGPVTSATRVMWVPLSRYTPSPISRTSIPDARKELTQFSSQNSDVFYGNLLSLPVANGMLYVEPIYLRAENGPIPELKRVVVSTGNRVVMEPTLEEALAKLFGASPSAVPSVGSTTSTAQAAPSAPGLPAAGQAVPPGSVQAAPSSELASVIQSANLHYTRAQEALKAGDWARYGEEIRQLCEALKRLNTPAAPPPAPREAR